MNGFDDFCKGILIGAVTVAMSIWAIVLLSGCSTVSISTPEGYKASYTRIGSQDISGLTYSRDGNSTLIGLDRQHTDSKTMDVIKLLLGGAQ